MANHNDLKYPCPQCDKFIKNVERHIRENHTHRKTFWCRCGYSSKRKDNLTRHLTTHLNNHKGSSHYQVESIDYPNYRPKSYDNSLPIQAYPNPITNSPPVEFSHNYNNYYRSQSYPADSYTNYARQNMNNNTKLPSLDTLLPNDNPNSTSSTASTINGYYYDSNQYNNHQYYPQINEAPISGVPYPLYNASMDFETSNKKVPKFH